MLGKSFLQFQFNYFIPRWAFAFISFWVFVVCCHLVVLLFALLIFLLVIFLFFLSSTAFPFYVLWLWRRTAQLWNSASVFHVFFTFISMCLYVLCVCVLWLKWMTCLTGFRICIEVVGGAHIICHCRMYVNFLLFTLHPSLAAPPRRPYQLSPLCCLANVFGFVCDSIVTLISVKCKCMRASWTLWIIPVRIPFLPFAIYFHSHFHCLCSPCFPPAHK